MYFISLQRRVHYSSENMFHSGILKHICLCIFLLNSNQFSLGNDFEWDVYFENSRQFKKMGESEEIKLKIVDLNKTEMIESNAVIKIVSDSKILQVSKTITIDAIDEGGNWSGSFMATAVFIGHANVFAEIIWKNDGFKIEKSSNAMTLNIIRDQSLKTAYDDIYKIYEICFNIILRILCGMAIDWKNVVRFLRKPIGLGISCFCNFVFTPLVRFDCAIKSKMFINFINGFFSSKSQATR